jgi:bifunctional DNA-binding transcriptional regulator/antitoxin component of YhaV-PrlF toxin-antitoxin module
VSIPSQIRRQFNIEPESRVEWIVESNVIKVVPLPKDPIAAFRGRGSRKYSTERLIKDRRAEREKEGEQVKALVKLKALPYKPLIKGKKA